MATSKVLDRQISAGGMGTWRPAFFQPLNVPGAYVTTFSMTALAVSMATGMNQILIPTLQHLFNMTSLQMSLILISSDLSGMLVAFLIGHFGSSDKIKWLSVGVMLTVLSSIMQAGTQFFVELPESPSNITSAVLSEDNMCLLNGGSDNDLTNHHSLYSTSNNHLTWILFLAGTIQGIGGTPTVVSGLSYLDEIMSRQELGPTLALVQILSDVGFPLSYVVGGFLLTKYVTLGDAPPGVEPGTSHWVGAWWMGYLIPGFVILLFGLPMMMFPKQMPASLEVLQKKINRGETTHEEKAAELNRSFEDLFADLVPTLRRLFGNIPLFFIIVGHSLICIAMGSIPYDNKIYSLLFKISVSETGKIFGTLKILATVVGLLLSGGIIAKFKLTGRKCILLLAVSQLLSLPVVLSYFVYCKPDTLAGIDIAYSDIDVKANLHPSLRNLSAECNSACNCAKDFYDPVCDITQDITFFSACHAGCSGSIERNGTVIYTECSCAANSAVVIQGRCPREQECDEKKWMVLIASNIGFAFFLMGAPALNFAYLRVVPEIDRSATQGLKQLLTRALGLLPGPIIFGAIIDNYCTVWRGDEDDPGSCWVYDIPSLMTTYVLTQFMLRTGVIVCFFGLWCFFPSDEEKQVEDDVVKKP